jgi:hypothetical protein
LGSRDTFCRDFDDSEQAESAFGGRIDRLAQ